MAKEFNNQNVVTDPIYDFGSVFGAEKNRIRFSILAPVLLLFMVVFLHTILALQYKIQSVCHQHF